jgi:hypothetical protein
MKFVLATTGEKKLYHEGLTDEQDTSDTDRLSDALQFSRHQFAESYFNLLCEEEICKPSEYKIEPVEMVA